MAPVVLKNIRKSFGAVEVIKGIDLTVEDGAFCVFVGPSGCGKSTLLRIIAGLDCQSSGVLEIDGRDVSAADPSQRGIAMGCRTYGIRPEHIAVSTVSGLWQASIRHIERLGADAILYCEVADLGPIVVRTQGDVDLGADPTVWLTPIDGKEHRFES